MANSFFAVGTKFLTIISWSFGFKGIMTGLCGNNVEPPQGATEAENINGKYNHQAAEC
jgi:hypothetical protein